MAFFSPFIIKGERLRSARERDGERWGKVGRAVCVHGRTKLLLSSSPLGAGVCWSPVTSSHVPEGTQD